MPYHAMPCNAMPCHAMPIRSSAANATNIQPASQPTEEQNSGAQAILPILGSPRPEGGKCSAAATAGTRSSPMRAFVASALHCFVVVNCLPFHVVYPETNVIDNSERWIGASCAVQHGPSALNRGIYLIGTSPAIRMLSMRASAREAPRLATGEQAGRLVRAGWLAARNGRFVCVRVPLRSVN